MMQGRERVLQGQPLPSADDFYAAATRRRVVTTRTTRSSQRTEQQQPIEADMERIREVGARMREFARDGICPICFQGGFDVIGLHISQAHRIRASLIRELAGIARGASLCTPAYSEYRRGVNEKYGVLPPTPHPDGTRGLRWTARPETVAVISERSRRLNTAANLRTADARARSVARHAETIAERQAEVPHGTEAKYRLGCKCDSCRKAHAAVYREFRRTGHYDSGVSE